MLQASNTFYTGLFIIIITIVVDTSVTIFPPTIGPLLHYCHHHHHHYHGCYLHYHHHHSQYSVPSRRHSIFTICIFTTTMVLHYYCLLLPQPPHHFVSIIFAANTIFNITKVVAIINSVAATNIIPPPAPFLPP